MKKLISRWFGLKADKANDPFFRKDEEGKDVFYPWSYPGEAFYINKNKKITLLLFLYSVFILFLTVVVASMYVNYKNIISQDFLFYINAIVFMFFPIFYVGAMHFFHKTTISHLMFKEDRPLKKIFLTWFIIVFVQAAAMISAINDSFISFAVLIATYTFFITCFLVKIKKTKGYFFNK